MTTTFLMNFYYTLDALMGVYALYSWYQQVRIEHAAVYRWSSIIWSVILIWIGFIWDFLENGPGLPIFLAIFLVISILDGFSGLGNKRIVLSGYFHRTLNYADLEQVSIFSVPQGIGPMIMLVLHTKSHRIYYLRFKTDIETVVKYLKEKTNNQVAIQIEIMQ